MAYWLERRLAYAVGRSGIHSSCQVIPKDFKKWFPWFPLLGARNLGEVVDNKPAKLFVVSLGKAWEALTFVWKTSGPDTSEMATPKRVWTSRPKYSDIVRFLVNGG